MKKIGVLTVAVLLSLTLFAKTPKYVFYFIGDGMGFNAVQMTELYLQSLDGELGVKPLVMSSFPVTSVSTTYSASSDVTDSAASGTALATGTKTKNGRLGMNYDATEPLYSIAVAAKASGKKVGITTSVGINHATPGAFFAHQNSRDNYYEISLDMIAAGFDFYGGSHLEKKSTSAKGERMKNIFDVLDESGYTVCRGVEEFNEKCAGAEKMLMLPEGGKRFGYQIDRLATDPSKMSLVDITASAIKFLDNKKGFFLMVEGGNIDGAEHGHDAATTIQEVIDFDNSIAVAVEFYKKHPDETLIVVTADHETGGLAVNPTKPEHLSLLKYQKFSQVKISDILKKKIKAQERPLSWEETREFLTEYTGLWGPVNVSWEQEKFLHDTYELTVAKNEAGHQVDLYADNALLVARAISVLNENAHVHWTTSHSASVVPVFAMGAGSEQFSSKMDNALIPRVMAGIAKYKIQ